MGSVSCAQFPEEIYRAGPQSPAPDINFHDMKHPDGDPAGVLF